MVCQKEKIFNIWVGGGKRMKRIFLFLFLGIFLINIVNALDCQYTVPVRSEIAQNYSYNGSEKFDYLFLEIREFSGTSFKAHNNHNQKINSTVFFINNGNQDNETLEIDSLGYELVDRGALSNISFDTIRFVFEDNSLRMGTKNVSVITGEECRICSGVTCLNDGAICNPFIDDLKCGSGVCNIASICGTKGSLKIVACEAYGKLNCDNKICFSPGTKEGGEAYSCESECESGKGKDGVCDVQCTNGTLTCDNRTCVNASSKNTGEPYTCLQECKSGRGKDNVCKWSITDEVLFWSVCIIFVSGGVLYFAVYKRREEEGRAKEAKEKVQQANKDLENIEVKGKNLSKEISDLENKFNSEKVKKESTLKELDEKLKEQKENVQKEINYWHTKKKTAKEEAKANYDKTIKKLENEEGLISDKIEEVRRDKITLFNSILERDKIAEKSLENTEKEKNAAVEKYGGKEKVFVNDKGYVQFKQDLFDSKKAGKNYHWWLYRSKLPQTPKRCHIHHIDGNKLNNEMWNLIALDEYFHEHSVKEGRIKGESWEFGLNYLLGMGEETGKFSENDLHEYIKRHREELSE